MFSWLSNLRVRFLLLVVAALIPALGLLLITADEQRDQAIATAQEEARRIAALAAADQQQRIEGTRQLLAVLEQLPEVRAGGAACSQLLTALLTDFPLYDNFGVIAPDGSVTCSALPVPEGVNLSDRAYFQRALAAKEFAVGEYQTGRITGTPVLNCGYPMLDAAGNVLGVVFAAIGLDALGSFAAQAQLVEGSILTVFDRNGRVLVRSPADAVRIGDSLAGTPVVATVLAQGNGITEVREEGKTYLYAYASLGGATPGDAYLSIAVPKDQVVARAEDAFSENLTRLGLVCVVVLVAAWVGGDLLVRRNTEANKALVRRLYDAFNSGGVDLLDDVVDTEFHDHDPMPGQAEGLPGLKQAIGLFRAAFPDGEMVITDLVAEGDKVVARVTLRGTQSGDFSGVPASGQAVSAEGIEVFRIAGGKIVEGWSRYAFPGSAVGFTPMPD